MLDDILNFIQLITATDGILLLLFTGFAITGFVRGSAKIIIHSLWLILGVIIAGIYYQDLTNLNLFSFVIESQQVRLLVNFSIILLLFLLLKFAIYRLLNVIANIQGPCPLNRIIAVIIGLSLTAMISWYVATNVTDIELIYRFITNDFTRIILSFILTFFGIIITAIVLSKLLHIKVGIDRPCSLIIALQPLNSLLNAKNINHLFNNISGIIFGMLQGLIFILTLIIINNHLHLLDNYELYNTNDYALIHLKNWANHIQQVLRNYLLFIN